jgi:hypothetical protein
MGASACSAGTCARVLCTAGRVPRASCSAAQGSGRARAPVCRAPDGALDLHPAFREQLRWAVTSRRALAPVRLGVGWGAHRIQGAAALGGHFLRRACARPRRCRVGYTPHTGSSCAGRSLPEARLRPAGQA